MSMNIKVVHPTEGDVSVAQTPTNISYAIVENSNPKQVYIDWVKTLGWDDDITRSHINHIERCWTDNCKVYVV